jgi:acyl-[acyl carrier protein]--UDP-N-acetylglucosamine O-acyltransferase
VLASFIKLHICLVAERLSGLRTYFLLRYAKYQNIRTSYNSLFQKEGTNDADLLRVILNPESLSATKQICNFIKDASTYCNDET